MLLITLGFITSFFVVLFGTPSLIKVAKLKHLVDEPGEARKLHSRSIPTIGGIMIFSGFLFSFMLWFPSEMNHLQEPVRETKYLISMMVLLFFVGVKDDIIGTAPLKKLIAHLIVAFILVMMAEIRITSMHGIFGIGELPEWASVLLTIFVYIVIVNAYNLIDGIDGLAGGIGFINCIVFGIWFYYANQPHLCLVAYSLAGALLAFLVFNFQPARIFMGDSGSLTIGAVISILAIKAIETPNNQLQDIFEGISTPVFVMCVLAYPLIDTLRVFSVRAYNGHSPFSADKNHIHHKLLNHGFSHAQAVLSLYVFSIMIVAIAVFIPIQDPTLYFLTMIGIAIGFILLTFLIFRKRKRKE